MGRIFETRKATMFARWDKMAKIFTRISKDITIAVKAGGPVVENNPSLRRAVQNARAANMPKDKVENAIKRAAGNDASDYQELIYEGYGPHGIAVLVQTATDNPTRTVANVRNAFNKGGGNMGSTGSVAFQFNHMGVFRLSPEGVDAEEIELDLIDHGLEEMGEGMLSDELNFEDFLKQMRMMKKLGSMESLLEMMPGAANLPAKVRDNFGKDAGKEMKRTEAIIQSMTPRERRNPNLLNGSRKRRIAAGSGTRVQEVNELLKKFQMAREMTGKMKQHRKKLLRFGR